MEEELELSDGANPALPIVIALKPLPMALGFGFGLTHCFFVSFLVIMDVRVFVVFSFFSFFAGLSSLSVSVAPPCFFVPFAFFFSFFVLICLIVLLLCLPVLFVLPLRRLLRHAFGARVGRHTCV